MAKLGIYVKLKENAWISKSGLSWLKYKQHDCQCFPNFSSAKEPLKQQLFYVPTNEPSLL
jgi:ubiquitin